MAENSESEASDSVKTVQASAGTPQSKAQTAALAAMGNVPEPSAADLDARQAAIGKTRRSGPPLPEGSDSSAPAMAMTANNVVDEPQTEVKEPRPKDR